MDKPQHLRSFVAIAQHGSVRGAARTLGVSQVAVSRSLRALEAEIGEKLFMRSAGGTDITMAGTALLPRAKHVIDQLDRMSTEIGRLRGASVSVGITPLANFILLEHSLPEFRRRQPKVQLRIVDGLLSQVVPQLRDGSLDFALVGSFASAIGDDFIFEPCFTTGNSFAVRHSHPLAGRNVSLAELVKFDWIQNEAVDGLHGKVEKWLAESGCKPPQTILCNSFSAILGALLVTDSVVYGPTMLARHSALGGLAAHVNVDIDVPDTTFGFLLRRDLPLSKSAALFKKLLIEAARTVPELSAK